MCSNRCQTCGSPTASAMPLPSDAATAATCSTAWPRHERFSRRRSVGVEYTYDYAVVRVVPRVDRGEQINVGVILSCVDIDFLDARIDVDEAVLRAVDPDV